MADDLRPDICVIGGGSGGLTVAAAAAQFGVDVVLIERDKMGGDCLNYGCVPSKALLAAAKSAASWKKSAAFGVTFGAPSIDYGAVNAHVQSVIGDIAPHDSVERFESLGVTVLQESAHFLNKQTVQAGTTRIRARRFVIATGSRAALPPISGLSDVAYLTNETIFDLTQAPRSLIILGGGPIGCELAQAHARLGVTVTLIEMASLLAKDDPKAVDLVRAALRDEGIALFEHHKATHVEQALTGDIRVTIEGERGSEILSAEKLLVATGRTPQLDGLNLAAADIAFSPRGIQVDASLKTTNRNVFAIGDCTGGLQFTHVAGYHGGLVVGQILFRARLKENRSLIPWVTYTSPEIAHVGLTEEEARKDPKHRSKVQILTWPLEENDRAKAERKTAGFIKVIVGRGGKLLGADIVAENAGELINSWCLAIAAGLKVSAFRQMVVPYPTLGEVGKRAALTYYAASLSHPLVRRLIRFLRLLG